MYASAFCLPSFRKDFELFADTFCMSLFSDDDFEALINSSFQVFYYELIAEFLYLPCQLIPLKDHFLSPEL